MSRRGIVVSVSTVLVALLAVGLYLFQPWRLATTRTVDDTLLVPVGTSSASSPASTTTVGTTSPASPVTTPPAGPVAVVSGPFRSLEHATTGSATLVRLPGGGHVVQFEQLATSDGPDLHVYLSDKASSSGDAQFATGFTSLGKLKGNQGNQVYEIPADADLDSVRSVVIWCKRFSAGFAVAPLERG